MINFTVLAHSVASPSVVNALVYLLPALLQTHSDSISVKLLGGFEGSVSYRHLPGTAADPTTCQLKAKVKK